MMIRVLMRGSRVRVMGGKHIGHTGTVLKVCFVADHKQAAYWYNVRVRGGHASVTSDKLVLV
jgi:ribosomal protein L24